MLSNFNENGGYSPPLPLQKLFGGKHTAAFVDTLPPLTEKIRWTEFELFPKVQPGVKTEEAWTLPEKGRTTTNSATVLGAIGEFNVPFTCCSTWSTL